MAGAMLRGWLDAGVDPAQITIIRPSGRPVAEGVRVVTRPPDDETPAMLMLGMKPYQLNDVSAVFERLCDPYTVLVSILAGTRENALRSRFPRCDTIVRAMPNTPVALRKGVIALHSLSADDRMLKRVEELMSLLGLVEWIHDEELFDVVTALAGSGPAFLFRFVDALAAAGADLGLAPDQAERLATATVEGAAALAARSGASPGELASRVASKGGSTEKGLNVLDRRERLKQLLRQTLDASVRRNREMGRPAGEN
jgi:pyrroline-5-carboxylate reductase